MYNRSMPKSHRRLEREEKRARERMKKEKKELETAICTEEIEDFEHKLGIRMKKKLAPDSPRYIQMKKEKEKELKEMGIKVRKPQTRTSSPFAFYDQYGQRPSATPDAKTGRSSSRSISRLFDQGAARPSSSTPVSKVPPLQLPDSRYVRSPTTEKLAETADTEILSPLETTQGFEEPKELSRTGFRMAWEARNTASIRSNAGGEKSVTRPESRRTEPDKVLEPIFLGRDSVREISRKASHEKPFRLAVKRYKDFDEVDPKNKEFDQKFNDMKFQVKKKDREDYERTRLETARKRQEEERKKLIWKSYENYAKAVQRGEPYAYKQFEENQMKVVEFKEAVDELDRRNAVFEGEDPLSKTDLDPEKYNLLATPHLLTPRTERSNRLTVHNFDIVSVYSKQKPKTSRNRKQGEEVVVLDTTPFGTLDKMRYTANLFFENQAAATPVRPPSAGSSRSRATSRKKVKRVVPKEVEEEVKEAKEELETFDLKINGLL